MKHVPLYHRPRILPNYLGLPFRILVSPFVHFDPENRTTDIMMFNSRNLGALIVDEASGRMTSSLLLHTRVSPSCSRYPPPSPSATDANGYGRFIQPLLSAT